MFVGVTDQEMQYKYQVQIKLRCLYCLYFINIPRNFINSDSQKMADGFTF